MGVRLTSREDKVALYDSVSDIAFGPVFDSEEDAEKFLEWLAINDGRDARELSASEIDRLQYQWELTAHFERFGGTG